MLGILKSFYTKFYCENIFYSLVTPKKTHGADMQYASIQTLATSPAKRGLLLHGQYCYFTDWDLKSGSSFWVYCSLTTVYINKREKSTRTWKSCGEGRRERGRWEGGGTKKGKAYVHFPLSFKVKYCTAHCTLKRKCV